MTSRLGWFNSARKGENWSPSTCAANYRFLSLAQVGNTFTHTIVIINTKSDHGRVESQEKQATPKTKVLKGRTTESTSSFFFITDKSTRSSLGFQQPRTTEKWTQCASNKHCCGEFCAERNEHKIQSSMPLSHRRNSSTKKKFWKIVAQSVQV